MKTTILALLLAFGLVAQGDQEPATPAGPHYRLVTQYFGPRVPVGRGWVLVGAEQTGARQIQQYLFNTQSGDTVVRYLELVP